MSQEQQLHLMEREPQIPADIPKSAEIFRGDINDAVINVQNQTGVEIDKRWWDANVGNDGSTERILQRFDGAYANRMVEEQGLQPDATTPYETIEPMTTEVHQEAHKEETAWERYAAIGSTEYEQANQERIKDSKIKVVKIGEPDHSITLVASIKVDPETGIAVSGHENRPDAESMVDTERAFAEYLVATPPEKRAIIYEGDERIFDDRDEAIRRATDSGLVQYLAKVENVPAIQAEPTDAEVITTMEQLGVTREELLALHVARGLGAHLSGEDPDFIAGYVNHQAASLGIEGFDDYSDSEKQAIVAEGKLDEVKAELAKKVEVLLPALNGSYHPALDGEDLFVAQGDKIIVNPEFNVDDIYRISMDKLGWDGSTRLNEVAKLSMEMRDRVIFRHILEAHRDGKNPFVVYGGSHVVTLEPALRTYFENSQLAA